MSIKKELLDELTKEQLKELAENKGIKYNSLNKTRKDYYAGWDEKDRLVDLMSDTSILSVKEIEDFVKTTK